MNTISIIGCGWLGLPLAKHLIRAGFHIRGSTTRGEKLGELENAGIEPYLLTLDPGLKCKPAVSSLLEADALVINIPPGRSRENIASYHKLQISNLITAVAASTVRFVIFVSSTSVYPDLNRDVNEEDAAADDVSGKALLEAERMLFERPEFSTTVLRLSGLYGYGRHPVHYLAGRTNLPNARAPVNLVHRDDCIRVISSVIRKNIRGQVFSVSSDRHPSRKDLYTAVAARLGLTTPQFSENGKAGFKIVSNAKLKAHLNYEFLYPDPMDEAP
ncbi:MAG: SDR family oxidoreductase [Cyclonatronaceae bacterium]